MELLTKPSILLLLSTRVVISLSSNNSGGIMPVNSFWLKSNSTKSIEIKCE